MRNLFMTVIGFIAILLCGCSHSIYEEKEDVSLPAIIVAGDEYNPFFYLDEDGEIKGIDAELARVAFKRLGYEPELKIIDWDLKDKILESGEADCLWSCVTMTGCEGDYLWSGPYLYSRQMLMVRKDSDIRCIHDMDGLNVSLKTGSKEESLFAGQNDDGLPYAENVYAFLTLDEAVCAMRLGYADAVCGHEGALSRYVIREPDMYRIVDDEIMSAGLGVAFKKDGNNMLAEALTETLNDMQDEGITSDIVEKYGLDPKEIVWGKNY